MFYYLILNILIYYYYYYYCNNYKLLSGVCHPNSFDSCKASPNKAL